MSPTLRRLNVNDLGDLARLVAENIEGIEPGLRVIGSRLILGQAAVDLVALDARGSLVLVALDFIADNGLLSRVTDAYSWCLENPDTLQRLYPMANVASTRLPRVLCIVERLTDAFVRRIKHLSVFELDGLEFRHLEVDGVSAVYFDLVERLRRPAPVEPPSDGEGAIATVPAEALKRIAAEPPVVERTGAPTAEPDPFVAPEPALGVGAVTLPAPEPGASLETRMAELVAEPSAKGMSTEEYGTEDTVADAEAVAEGSAFQLGSVDATAPQEGPEAPSASAGAEATPEGQGLWQALLSQLGIDVTERTAQAPVEPNAAAAEPVALTAVETPAPTKTPPVWAKPSADTIAPRSSGGTYFSSPAKKGAAPAKAPTAKLAETPATAAATVAQKTGAPRVADPSESKLDERGAREVDPDR